MLALWLLAAHCAGDYLLQTRWQAVGKFGWSPEAVRLRWRHCTAYCVPFAPVALWARHDGLGGLVVAASFLLFLHALHFLTDAQRFHRTPGEWLAWRWMS